MPAQPQLYDVLSAQLKEGCCSALATQRQRAPAGRRRARCLQQSGPTASEGSGWCAQCGPALTPCTDGAAAKLIKTVPSPNDRYKLSHRQRSHVWDVILAELNSPLTPNQDGTSISSIS